MAREEWQVKDGGVGARCMGKGCFGNASNSFTSLHMGEEVFECKNQARVSVS